jgi:hypothetical protein
MVARSFNRVLEDLGIAEEELDGALSEPKLRVSARAGFVVAALGPEKSTGFQPKSTRYEDTSEGTSKELPLTPQLSLPELASQIGKAVSMEELRRLRRQFARFSHPDHSEDASATSEMAAANRLIDDAIASLRQEQGRG